tara:strand:- start:78 stop:287 length:210 start_codon:yes stop_codon:yes gene_type:complete
VTVKVGIATTQETAYNVTSKTRLSNLGLKIGKDYSDRLSGYIFGQNAIQRSGNVGRNNRLGAGFSAKVA